MSRAEKEALIEVLAERERRRREAPLLYYRPSPKQREVHQAFGTKDVVLFLGANKSGKTWCAVANALACSVGYRFWEVPDLKLTEDGCLPDRDTISPRHWLRNSKGIPIKVPNIGMVVTGLGRERGIGQVIMPVVEEFVSAGIKAKWHVTKGALGVPTQIIWPNGSAWILASKEQEALSFEGTRIQWASVDEPVQPFVYNGLARGLVMDGGPVLFTLTPLGADAAWMYEKWVKRAEDSAAVIKVAMTDNPALSADYIEKFAAQGEWTEAEKRARLFGEFEALANRVLYTFDRSVHVIPARLPPSGILGCTIDPHHTKPPVILWWVRDAWGVYEFYREYPADKWTKAATSGRGMTPTDLVVLIRNVEAARVSRVRIADPRFAKAAFTTHGRRDTPWIDLMARCGMEFDARIPNAETVEYGEQLLVDMMRWDKNFPISPTNTPKIRIQDSCQNLISAVENYGVMLSRDPTKFQDKRSDEWKDFIDAMRYTVLYPVLDESTHTWEVWGDDDWRRENHAWGDFQ